MFPKITNRPVIPFGAPVRLCATWFSILLSLSFSEVGVRAASDTWVGGTDGVWATPGNWLLGGVVPGAADTATFNAASANTLIDLGGGVSLNTLLFDTASAASYTIGSGGVGIQTLTLSSGGAITMNSTVAANQLIHANLALGSTATITNSSTTNDLILAGAISGATALTKAGAGIVRLDGNNNFTGITTVSAGTLQLGNANALGAVGATNYTVVNNNATLDLNGQTIAEAFGVAAASGDGFGGANATLINSSATAASITGTINFDGAGAFKVDGPGIISLTRYGRTSGTSGDVTLTKEGEGTLILGGTADNSAAGLVVNNGTVELAKSAGGVRVVGSVGVTLNGDAVGRITAAGGDQIFSSGSITMTGTSVFELNGFNEQVNNLNSAVATTVIRNGHATNASTLSVGGGNGSSTFAGVIENGGAAAMGIAQNGTGTLTLTNNNTYTGTTALNASGGGITLNFAAAEGTHDNLVSASSALSFTNTSAVRTQILTVTGDAGVINNQTFNGTTFAATAGRKYQIVTSSGVGGTLNLNLGALTAPSGVYVDFVLPTSGAIGTTNANSVLGATYTLNNGSSYAQILGNQIVAFGGDLIAETGVSIEALAAYAGGSRNLLVDNSSTGNVTQSTTPLQLSTAQFTDAANRTLTIGTGNTLQMGAPGGAGGILRSSAAGSVTVGEAGTAGELTTGSAAGDDLAFTNGNAAGTLTVNSIIKNNAGGAVDVIVNGAATALTVFTGGSTYTGGTTVQQGTLRVSNNSALGSTTGGSTVAIGAALEMAGGITIGNEALSLQGGGISNGGALRNVSGTNTYGGLITATATPRLYVDTGTTLILDRVGAGGSLTTDSSITLEVAGTGVLQMVDAFNTTGSANPTVAKNGNGTLLFESANTWAGNGSFTLNDGVVRISNGGALGGTSGGTVITDNAALELVGGITTNENITTSGTATGISLGGAIRNISGNNTISGSVTIDEGNARIHSDSDLLTISGECRGDPTSGSTARTPTLGGAGNITLSGVVRNGTGTTPGVLNLIKDGTGTLTLSNAGNTYTGTTAVNNGTLVLSGNINNASTLTMAAGTTFNQTNTGVLAGSVALLLNNATSTLSGTNTTTGATTLTGGTLNLNYDTGTGGTNTTKLANAAVLTLSGGTVNLQGGSHLELVGSTVLTASTTTVLNRPSGTSTLALGNITPGAGSLLSIQGNDFASTTTPNSGSILGGWATVTIAGVTDWAVNSGVSDGGTGSYIRQFAAAYTDITRLGPSTIPDNAALDVRIVNGGTSGSIDLASTATEIATLKMDASDGPATVAMAGSVLNIGGDAGSGIIQSATSGALTVGEVANQGTLTTGGTPNAVATALGLANDSVTQDLTIQSVIADNGSDVVSLSKSGAGRVVLNGTNTLTGSVAVGAGTLHIGSVAGASVTGALGANTSISNAGTVVFRRTDTADVDLAGVISGVGSVQYLGSGVAGQSLFTANNASTYTGGTLIDDARVTTGVSATALGTGAVTVASGGQAYLHNVTFTNDFSISGTGWAETAGSSLGALRLGGNAGNTTLSGAVALTADSRITADNTRTGTLNGVISGGFNVEIAAGNNSQGNGIVRFNAANLYTGTTTVLGVTSGANLPTLIVGNNLALGTTGAGAGTVVNGSTSTGAGTSIQLAGGVTVTDEDLTLTSASGRRTRLYLASGSTAAWDGNITTSGAGLNQLSTDGTLTIGGSATDTITMDSALVVRGVGTGTINSTISGTGVLSKTDASTWTINSSANTFGNTVTISTGTLSFGTIANAGSSSSIGTGSAINIGQNAAGSGGVGTMRYTGASGGSTNKTINIVNGASGGGGVIENTIAGQTLAISGNISASSAASASALTVTGAGNTTLSGNITGTPAMSLTKTGNGMLNLASASNTATGVTNVNAGLLNVVGQTGTGAVTVNTGATLLGTGSVRGSSFTLASGATLHAGAGTAQTDIGTLSFNPLATGAYNIQSGSNVYLGLNPGSTSDLLSFGGTTGSTLTFSGNLIIGPSSFTPLGAETFNLLDWAALVTPDFSGFAVGANRNGSGDNGSQFDLPDIGGDWLWDVSSFTTDGTISIIAVPEPSRLLLMLLGMMTLVVRRRR